MAKRVSFADNVDIIDTFKQQESPEESKSEQVDQTTASEPD